MREVLLIYWFKKTKRFSGLLLLLGSFFFLGSCAGVTAKPYDTSTEAMLLAYRSSFFKKAYNLAYKFVEYSQENQSQDYYLALLERGKIALAMKRYGVAIRDLQKAERHFLNIEGTFSISEESGSLFTNELGKEYELETHEMIMLGPYLALSYLLKKDFQGARVERNRIINKISTYIEESEKNHLENPFARYISALIYEMEGKFQDAKLEYRKLAKYNRHLEDMKREFRELGKESTQLVVLVETGLSPYKREVRYGPLPIPVRNKLITIAFAYAKLVVRSSYIGDCKVWLNGELVDKTRLLYDLEETVIRQYRKTKSKMVGNLIKRVTAKQLVSIGVQEIGEKTPGIGGGLLRLGGMIFGLATAFMEKADLRSWRTLGQRIHFSRLRNLPTGKQNVQVQCSGGQASQEMDFKENKIHFLYVNLPS